MGQAGDVEGPGEDHAQGGACERPADGGVADENPAARGNHRHPRKGGIEGNGEALGGDLRLIDKPECAEPVESLKNPAGTLAKAAEAVVEAGVGRGGGHGGLLGDVSMGITTGPQGCREEGKGRGLRAEGQGSEQRPADRKPPRCEVRVVTDLRSPPISEAFDVTH